MLDLDTLQKVDLQKMYEVYNNWPQLSKEYYELDFQEVNFSNIDNIVFAGMGGSGTIGDVCSSILSQTDVHVSVLKGYHIPKTIDSKTLIITISVSGNTVETLNVLQNSKDSDAKIIAFSSGGRMKDYCIKNQIKHFQIQTVHSSRASLPTFLFTILRVLERILPVKKQDVIKTIEDMQSTKQKISSSNLYEDNPALSLAYWITNMPIIYYPWGLQSAAIRFKNSLQENAKLHAAAEDVIEMCHNGIVAWEKASNLKPILIRGEDDHIKTKERWEVLKQYFRETEIEYKEVFSLNSNILSKIVNLIYLFDFATIYRAVLSGIDPTPVNSINFIKQRLHQ